MARMKLTAAAVDRIRPPPSGQDEYFDELLPSFGLRVSHSGTKAWIVMRRVEGRLVRFTVGRHPTVGLAEARKQAQEIIRLALEGIDPREAADARRRQGLRERENTFCRAAEEFISKHAEPNLRTSTTREYRRVLFGNDTAAWRERPLASITRRDVIELIDAIDRRGARTAASLTCAYLRAFFNWCLDREMLEQSPLQRLRLNRKKVSRARVLSPAELRSIWQAADEEPGVFGPIYKVLMLTGQRRKEVAGMTWDELRDLETDRAIWQIPASRTKNKLVHLVPLAPQVSTLLREQPRTAALVFPGGTANPVSGFSKVKRRVDARIRQSIPSGSGSGITPWRLHDLRRTMITSMNEDLGVAPHIVEAVVNHITGPAKAGVAGVYNRAKYLDERRIALTRWADLVSRLVGLR